MKVKKLKKIVKQHLFNFSLSKNLFMIFEIKNDKLKNSQSINLNIESFPKPIFFLSNYPEFIKMKFPNIIKSTIFLKDTLSYFLILKEKKFLCSIYLIKFSFFFLKDNIHILTNIFFEYKNLLLFNFFLTFLLKKKFLFLINKLFYPFITL